MRAGSSGRLGRLAWFGGLYLASLLVFAAAAYALRTLVAH
jgi:hypothetical protein